MHKAPSMYAISELADFFNVSCQTLRYYDKIGLMKPAIVDSQTGYRYYSEEQLDELYLIKSLKSMGLSLDEIRNYLSNKDIEVLERCLKSKICDITNKIKELQTTREYVEFMLGKIKLTDRVYQTNTYEIKEFQTRTTYLIGMHFEIKDLYQFIDILYKSYLNSRIYRNHQEHGRIVLTIHPDDLKEQRFNLYNGIGFLMNHPVQGENCIELMAGKYITTYHIGPYTTIHHTYRKLYDYTRQHQYQITGPSTEVSIIDNAYTSNPNEFITEIQFPIKIEQDTE